MAQFVGQHRHHLLLAALLQQRVVQHDALVGGEAVLNRRMGEGAGRGITGGKRAGEGSALGTEQGSLKLGLLTSITVWHGQPAQSRPENHVGGVVTFTSARTHLVGIGVGRPAAAVHHKKLLEREGQRGCQRLD